MKHPDKTSRANFFDSSFYGTSPFADYGEFDFIEHDIYSSDKVDSMLDNDELSENEAGFMKGYDEES